MRWNNMIQFFFLSEPTMLSVSCADVLPKLSLAAGRVWICCIVLCLFPLLHFRLS